MYHYSNVLFTRPVYKSPIKTHNHHKNWVVELNNLHFIINWEPMKTIESFFFFCCCMNCRLEGGRCCGHVEVQGSSNGTCNYLRLGTKDPHVSKSHHIFLISSEERGLGVTSGNDHIHDCQPFYYASSHQALNAYFIIWVVLFQKSLLYFNHFWWILYFNLVSS